MHVSMNSFQAHRPSALAWTAPPENFSSAIAIYAGHFLDMLFTATGWPDTSVGAALNQFKEIAITDTGEKIPTTNPDQLVVAGTIGGGAVSIPVEAGKRNGAGVQIDITGDEGDLRIVNTLAFGGVGDDYRIFGARGNAQPRRASFAQRDALHSGLNCPAASGGRGLAPRRGRIASRLHTHCGAAWPE